MEGMKARKIADQVTQDLFQLAKYYGKEHRHSFYDLSHDIEHLLEADALSQVRLRFMEKQTLIIKLEYVYGFNGTLPELLTNGSVTLVPLKHPIKEIEMSVSLGLVPGCSYPMSVLRGRWNNESKPMKEPGMTIERSQGVNIHVGYSSRTEGIVKSYSPGSQYGFITNGSIDVFFHTRLLAPGTEVHPGDLVTYTPFITPKGIQAHYVMKVNGGRTTMPSEDKGLLAAVIALCQKVMEKIQ